MDRFVTVYDLAEQGYRGTGWFLALAGLLLLILFYVYWLKPDSRGERIYRLSVLLVWLAACSALLAYHWRGYSMYRDLVQALHNGQSRQTTGAVTLVQPDGYFLFFDVDGQRFRCSRHEWPFRLGFHPEDFPLRPTFLVRVFTVDNVIVRLQIHRASLGSLRITEDGLSG